MASRECVVIVEPSTISPSNIGIQFLDLMICLMNSMGQQYFTRLISKLVITKLESKRVMSEKLLLRQRLDYMSG